jgi:hypothetical protein
MKTLKLALTPAEKQKLKLNRLKISELGNYAADEIDVILGSGKQRAREIAAQITFQQIPSVGPKFAQDLISLGYFSLDDLLEKEGSALFDEQERKQGFWTDPCVEDQFRLVVHYANHGSGNRNWWDFTAERKAYRAKHGYPANRPVTAWHETERHTTGNTEIFEVAKTS